MKRPLHLHVHDLIILVYTGIVTILLLSFLNRVESWPLYLAYHFAGISFILLIAHACHRFQRPGWAFLHHWYPYYLVLGCYRELHYLIQDMRPELEAYKVFPNDRVLASIDTRWFGDVRGWLEALWNPWAVDLFFIFYYGYFLLPVVAGGILYAKAPLLYRRYAASLLLGFALCFLGYIAVPARGPIHFEPRPSVLDGAYLGGTMHQWMVDVEWKMPDAFPSGHALAAMVTAGFLFRFHRRLFWWLLIPNVGIILSTIYLRYHYIIDVATSAALLPVILLAEPWVNRYFGASAEGDGEGTDPTSGAFSCGFGGSGI